MRSLKNSFKISSNILVVVFLLNISCQNGGEYFKNTSIIQENKFEGTKDWMIKVPYKSCSDNNHNYCRREQIEAYCSKTSYMAGDSLKIFISTDPASDYSLKIYRMGYYQGNGGRLVQDVGILKGVKQPMPQIDSTTNFLECNWALSYKQIIPKNWLSGVYIGKLTATRDSSQAYCIFIIKDNRKVDIVFQCSDLTWQSYNRWPYWHSMYDEGHKPWVNTNGAVISFNRPYSLYTNGLPSDFSPLSNGSGEFLLWEFPLAFWLEKEGYDVSYISNIDTHADTSIITRSKVFLSVGHDEYWTPTMLNNVKYAREKGVSMLFLGGNSLDGTVYLKPSSEGTPNRTTGRLPQREFHDEQDLMGASSYGVGYTDYIIKNSNSWVFEGTGLKTEDTIKDLVGWEYHGLPLSNKFPVEILAQAPIKSNKYGAIKSPDHVSTLYYVTDKSFVFNAGSCFWPLALSFPPGAQNPVNNQNELGKKTINFSKPNKTVQQITHNLLKKGIQ